MLIQFSFFVISLCLIPFSAYAESTQKMIKNSSPSTSLEISMSPTAEMNERRRPKRRRFYYELVDEDGNGIEEEDEDEDDDDEEGQEDDKSSENVERRRRVKKTRRAFGHSEYLLPENFRYKRNH
jgi:hypothetical protein